MQSDGKIVFAGILLPIDNAIVDSFVVWRLNANGSLDLTFGTNGYTNIKVPSGDFNVNWVNGLKVLSDGKILVLGQFALNGGMQGTLLVRLNANGSFDNTFGTNGIVEHKVFPYEVFNNLVVQKTGKIIIGGFAIWDSLPHAVLSRFFSNGTPDSTFDLDFQGDKLLDPINTTMVGNINLESDDKLVYVLNNYLPAFTGMSRLTGVSISLAKTDENGIPDATFGTNGISFLGYTQTIQVRTGLSKHINGKSIAYFTDADSTFIFQFSNTYAKDLGFNTTGKISFPNPNLKYYFAPINVLSLDNDNFVLSQTQVDSFINNYEYTSHLLTGITGTGTLMQKFGKNGQLKTQLPPDCSAGSGCRQADGKLVFGVIDPENRFSAMRYVGVFANGLSQEELIKEEATLYPNPMNGRGNLDYAIAKAGWVEITILDLSGKTICTILSSNEQAGQHQLQFDLPSSLNRSMYLCKINSESGSKIIKFILD
jgi:uncharacterized delta-60 repeat protein